MKTINETILKEKPVTPKVDILFVIDNSNSMDEHQKSLRSNIPRFLQAFQKKANVDFHIGMVTVHDPKHVVPGKKFYWENGKLRPVLHPNGDPFHGQTFVTRQEGYAQLLGRTLNIGTHDFKDGGPRYEEVFSPIAASMNTELNPGFWRNDAHMVVIMLTDAENSEFDLTTPEGLYAKMKGFKGGQEKMISTYGVLAVPDPKKRGKVCRPDEDLKRTGGLPNKLLQFIKISNGAGYDTRTNPNVLSICTENYGEYLSKVGYQIQEKISKKFRILLENGDVAQNGTVSVVINGKDVPHGVWTLEPDRKAVIIDNPDKYLDANGKGIVHIKYRPMDK